MPIKIILAENYIYIALTQNYFRYKSSFQYLVILKGVKLSKKLNLDLDLIEIINSDSKSFSQLKKKIFIYLFIECGRNNITIEKCLFMQK